MPEAIVPTKSATKVKDLTGFTGQAALYKLDPPLETRGWDTKYVVVSATSEYVTETYIFPADSDGNITDWGELDGSYKGGLDHAEALRAAGYEVAA